MISLGCMSRLMQEIIARGASFMICQVFIRYMPPTMGKRIRLSTCLWMKNRRKSCSQQMNNIQQGYFATWKVS